ncbi:MAG: glycine/D-amino acid oxidase-like deaminating enzyme [Porticoccaceae bacterium]|jgi:glycine/D-amino acid oxidase-like deaminating enzyme
MDKGKPGMAASFGNAGLLAHWAVAPVTSPQLWRNAPKMLLSPSGPLFIQWSYLLSLAPWLLKFMANATDAKTRRIVKNLDPLIYDTVEQHKSLVQKSKAEKWIIDSKFSFAYESEAAFKTDAYSWEMRASVGLKPTIVTGDAVREEEPILGPSIQCLAVLEGQGHISNPGQYITELCKVFTDEGGKLVQAEVQDIHKTNGRVSHVDTDHGSFDCSRAVITSGIWSKELTRKLGLTIPMETERGYHILFENPSEVPRNPMIMTSGKFGVTPMESGLRCAGTVELADHRAQPNRAPLVLIKKRARAAFPNLQYTGTQEWMGCRPTPPDSTPLIGELGNSGIFTGFGHQHIGITAGPKTGRLIAQLIDGQTPNMDMAPYSPDRYIG